MNQSTNIAEETSSQKNRREFIEYFGYTPEEGAVMQAQAETFRPNRVGGNIYRRLSNEGSALLLQGLAPPVAQDALSTGQVARFTEMERYTRLS